MNLAQTSKKTWKESLLFPKVNLNAGELEKSVKGKTILITGASSGIGAVLVQLFLDVDCKKSK